MTSEHRNDGAGDADTQAHEDTEALTGTDLVKAHVKTLPTTPGVYRMYDSAGELLYVGKARNLKSRVANYAHLTGHNNRIAAMIQAIAAMEFTLTRTETEALLLEANLIKAHRPRYNVLLRDDKSFASILIARDHPYPQILKHRGARNREGDYFGPFASAGAVNRTLNTLQKAFLLRSCDDTVFEGRSRPCLLHQIKRCSAPCVGFISHEDYHGLVDEAVAFLRGKASGLRERLSREMSEAAEREDFETAARLRDRIRALAAIEADQVINPETVGEADVFAITVQGGQSCVVATFFRAGQNWGDKTYFPRHDKEAEPETILSAFIAQFYDARTPPPLILLDRALEEMALLGEALTIKAGQKVELRVPQRGEKRTLIEQTAENAKEALARKLSEAGAQAKLLKGVADAFDLAAPPQRIEVYDNSHIAGTNPVGAMIVAGPEGFEKRAYRKFNMRSDDLTPGDDYAMMKEMLRRRFKRLGGAKDDTSAQRPDLVLIDGGRGQLSAALEIMDELDVSDIPVAAIAKGPDRDAGREQFFMAAKDPFMLPPKDPALFYIQRLRDEAHRFAVGSHIQRRKKASRENPLDSIPGVGAKRKQALLHHFGSARSVARASVSDLQAVDGVSEDLAQRIYDFFRESS